MNQRQPKPQIAQPRQGIRLAGWLPFVLLLAVGAVTGSGDGSTASLTLSGTVSRTVSISVTPENNYNSLDLVGGETEKAVAIINERSNDKAGYTVAITSIGAGSTSQAQLRPVTPGNPDTIPYSLKYGGATVAFNLGHATLTSTSGRTSGAGTNIVLAVTIPSAGGVTADTYSDTLQLTIQGN
jgi:spore coat protein U-like protein